MATVGHHPSGPHPLDFRREGEKVTRRKWCQKSAKVKRGWYENKTKRAKKRQRRLNLKNYSSTCTHPVPHETGPESCRDRAGVRWAWQLDSHLCSSTARFFWKTFLGLSQECICILHNRLHLCSTVQIAIGTRADFNLNLATAVFLCKYLHENRAASSRNNARTDFLQQPVGGMLLRSFESVGLMLTSIVSKQAFDCYGPTWTPLRL